jgi:hypothetical protein
MVGELDELHRARTLRERLRRVEARDLERACHARRVVHRRGE